MPTWANYPITTHSAQTLRALLSPKGTKTEGCLVAESLATSGLPPIPKGRARTALKAQWLPVIEALIVAGIERPSHMANHTGLTFHTAKRWMFDVRSQWAAQLNRNERGLLSEQLYQQAANVAEIAWHIARTSNNPWVVMGALKTVLESVDKRANIYGLND
jgi:hypothetical protein